MSKRLPNPIESLLNLTVVDDGEKVANDSPEDRELRVDVARTHYELGRLVAAFGKKAEAEEQLRLTGR